MLRLSGTPIGVAVAGARLLLPALVRIATHLEDVQLGR